MSQYSQPISTHGFQQISFASDTENYGIGSFLLDVGINMGLESAASALLGQKGILGYRPLFGVLPGAMPPGFDPANAGGVIDEFMNTRVAGRPRRQWSFRRATPSTRIGDHINGPSSPTSRGGRNPINWLRRKMHSPEREMLDSYAASGLSAKHGAPGLATANRMNIGLGLRSVARAWMFTDMFATGFSVALGSIQGLNTFNYERRHREGHSELDLGEGFADTRGSYTQRQTAMAAIHNSQMNTRAAMGNEATFMHA
jgi:hypothetical protein